MRLSSDAEGKGKPCADGKNELKSDVPEGLPRTPEYYELIGKLRSHGKTPSEKGMFSDFSSWCDESGSFNPARFAKDIVDNYPIKTDRLNDQLYFYDETRGFWDRNGDAWIRTIIDACLGNENRQHRTTETIYLVHSQTFTTIKESHKIAVQNGLLDPETQRLEPFTPLEFVTVRLPVRYEMGADCPMIKKFMAEIFEPDQIPMVQEMIGYCLLREMLIHTSMVLLGEGWNGKTTFIDIVNAFLGAENCSHVTLQNLCEGKFELAQLYGKLANICDDLPGTALKSVGNFKNLTGNAPIMAQFKHKNPFDFLNTAKMFWTCNKLPPPSEDTVAYYRRFLILPLTKKFIPGINADLNLVKKLTTPEELSGLLNYALEGRSRLLAQGRFTNSKTVDETRVQYIRTADSCQAFIEEMTEIDSSPDAFITDEILYKEYVSYCRENRLPVIQRKAQLTVAMQRDRPEAKHTKERVKGKGVLGWQFIKFVPTDPAVPADLLLRDFSGNQNSKNKKEAGTSGTSGTNSTSDHSTLFPFTPPCDPKTEDIKDTGDTNILKDVKDWCYTHRNERSEISLNELSVFARDSLRVEPRIVVKHAFEQGILAPNPKPGMAVVV